MGEVPNQDPNQTLNPKRTAEGPPPPYSISRVWLEASYAAGTVVSRGPREFGAREIFLNTGFRLHGIERALNVIASHYQ